MRVLLFILLFLSTLNLCAQKSKPTDPFGDIEAIAQRALKEQGAAGMAIAIVKKDKVVWMKGVGFRDLENKKPVTPQTLFAIGSCTKAFTASLVGMLSDEGKLDYDKPVRNYLPTLHFFNDEMNSSVSARDMMTHRTGLPRHDISWYLFQSSSRDSLLARIEFLEPTAHVAKSWQYNNFMYMALGSLTEKITGQSWEENVQRRIFNPLEMIRSNFTIDSLKTVADAAKGYQTYKDSIIRPINYRNINGIAPAGSINSSVEEMSRWLITWINGGRYNGKKVIPDHFVSQAIRSQMVAGSSLPDPEFPEMMFTNYGLGWVLSSYRGHYMVEHDGNIDGFSASVRYFPTDSVGMIVLTNQNGSAIPAIMGFTIADRILNLDRKDWNQRIADGQKKGRKAQAAAIASKVEAVFKNGPPTHPLRDFAGLYENPGYGHFETLLSNDSLFIIAPGGDRAWLKHKVFDVFKLYQADPAYGIDTTQPAPTNIHFHLNNSGEIYSATLPLEAGLDEIEFTRKPKEEPILPAALKKFEGDYEFAPNAVAKFYVKNEKTLCAFIKGQPEYELLPIGKNKFSIKLLSGYSIEFNVNEAGEVTSANFIQPNGTFTAKKINQ